MRVKQFLSAAGAVTFLYGIGLIILPDTLAEAHGATNLNNFTLLNLRMFGGALIGAGVMFWMAMPARQSYGRRAILAFSLIFDASVVILNLMEIGTNGNAHLMHWIDIGFAFLFAIGAGYFLTKEKDLKF